MHLLCWLEFDLLTLLLLTLLRHQLFILLIKHWSITPPALFPLFKHAPLQLNFQPQFVFLRSLPSQRLFNLVGFFHLLFAKVQPALHGFYLPPVCELGQLLLTVLSIFEPIPLLLSTCVYFPTPAILIFQLLPLITVFSLILPFVCESTLLQQLLFEFYAVPQVQAQSVQVFFSLLLTLVQFSMRLLIFPLLQYAQQLISLPQLYVRLLTFPLLQYAQLLIFPHLTF